MPPRPKHIVTLLLAAGASARLGQPKQLLRHDGETLVRRAARTAAEAQLGPVIAVIASDDPAVRGEVSPFAHQIVINRHANRGLGSSIKAGVAAMEPSIDAILILLCDQIAVTPALLRSLANALSSPGIAAAASAYGGGVGVPAVFSRELFPALQSIADDAGAKTLLESLGNRLAKVDFPGGTQDIDTLADLHRLS